MSKNQIQIRNVKNIELLEFDMPDPGVYVLTGENGSGKTTLLACVTRLGERDSFPRHFRTSTISSKLDVFDDAEIKYVGPSQNVVYRYSGTRWEPTPKRNGKDLHTAFGYSEVLYIAADAKRVTPRQEDFKTNRIKAAPQFVIDNANVVFGTNKFSSLKTVNVKKGVGQQAYVFEKPGTKSSTYFSERNFSLGELAVLKLLRSLNTVKPNALLIIDELELALYPLAQERLLRVISGRAKALNLTVIFSTHSATLIRAVAPNQLLFLERNGGTVTCVRNCYPTYALGRIGSPGEAPPDIVLLVEDPNANAFTEALIHRSAAELFKSAPRPSIQIATIGGYEQVLKFLDKSGALFHSTTVKALLDKDCEQILNRNDDIAPPQVGSNEAKNCELYKKLKANVHFLPTTPEVGLLNQMSTNWSSVANYMSGAYFNNSLMGLNAPAFTGNPANKPDRDSAKQVLKTVVATFESATSKTERQIIESLFKWYVDELERLNPNSTAAVIGPIIR